MYGVDLSPTMRRLAREKSGVVSASPLESVAMDLKDRADCAIIVGALATSLTAVTAAAALLGSKRHLKVAQKRLGESVDAPNLCAFFGHHKFLTGRT